MKKTLIFISLFVLMISSVFACHCVDTDALKPTAVPFVWGDNALLGGTSSFWLSDNTPVPEGCTGTSQGSYVCTDKCLADSYTLREFYCSGTDTVNYIFWNDYPDSTECGYEVPEFGVVAGGLALIASIGIIAYRRK